MGRLASSATLGSSISKVLMNMWSPAKPWAQAWLASAIVPTAIVASK